MAPVPPTPPAAPRTPQSPAAVSANTPNLSPSTAMPRMHFSLRSPPSRPVSPPRPALDASASLVFSGDVWVPAESSYFSFGFGAKWTRTALTMWMARVVDDAAALPLLHMRLGDRAVLVAVAVHRPPTLEKPPDKKLIEVDVKAVDDVRRAVLYHTAAPSSVLAFYVDTDFARDHLINLIHHVLASSPSQPHAVRTPSPPPTTVTQPYACVPSPDENAFVQLDMARAKQQRGHVVDALTAYASADRALAAAAIHCADATLRTRIVHARQEIRAAVDALEMEKALPRAAISVTATTLAVSDPPVSTSTTTTTTPTLPTTAAPTPTTPTPTTTMPTIDARLVELQAFTHTRDVDRAQRERRVAADDLTLRLHALRNDKPTAPSMESLQERLERLRGGSPSDPSRGSSATRITPSTTLSPVDQIIQQAMDEVALGIVDDAADEHDGDTSHSSSGSSDDDSDDDDDDDDANSPRGRRYQRRDRP